MSNISIAFFVEGYGSGKGTPGGLQNSPIMHAGVAKGAARRPRLGRKSPPAGTGSGGKTCTCAMTGLAAGGCLHDSVQSATRLS